MIVLEQTAQTLRADDLAVGVLRSRLNHPPAKPRVGTLVVVVLLPYLKIPPINVFEKLWDICDFL